MSPRTKAAVSSPSTAASSPPREGETVLDVARREGIDIPALCHQEGMAAWGACRLCMVEVEGLDKLQAACTTWVTDGLVVKTDTPARRARRESYLKMYLSDHNSYCEAPCSHACPTHIDIPAYMAALAAGDAAGAAAIVREELPFPGILGRVCPRYCEPVCRRGDVDEPIAICALHRAAADHSDTLLVRASRPAGASPSSAPARPASPPPGSSRRAATRSRSTTPTSSPAARCATASPSSACPRRSWRRSWPAVGRRRPLRRRVGAAATRSTPTACSTPASTRSSSASAPGKSRKKVLPGDDAALNGLELLKRVREGRAVKFTQTVAVIGDGITAFDVARTARRLGAKDVVVIAQHEADDIPAGARELAAALEEGVKFEFGALAKKVKAKAGKAQGVECVRVVREKGRPKEVRGSRFELAATTVILATGYAPKLGDSADYLPLADGAAARQLLHRPHARGRRVRRRRRPHRRPVGHPRRRRRQALGAGRRRLAARRRPRGARAEPGRLDGLPYLEQLKDEAQLGDLGARLAERSPVWLKMGASAEPEARATMPKVGKAKRLSATDVEVEKGYTLAAARAEASAACSASAPASATATCRSSASSTASPTTTWS